MKSKPVMVVVRLFKMLEPNTPSTIKARAIFFISLPPVAGCDFPVLVAKLLASTAIALAIATAIERKWPR
jgi:hypothetical protein